MGKWRSEGEYRARGTSTAMRKLVWSGLSWMTYSSLQNSRTLNSRTLNSRTLILHEGHALMKYNTVQMREASVSTWTYKAPSKSWLYSARRSKTRNRRTATWFLFNEFDLDLDSWLLTWLLLRRLLAIATTSRIWYRMSTVQWYEKRESCTRSTSFLLLRVAFVQSTMLAGTSCVPFVVATTQRFTFHALPEELWHLLFCGWRASTVNSRQYS